MKLSWFHYFVDLQLPVQSVPITTKVVSSNPVHGEVYLIQYYVIKFVSDLRQLGRWFSPVSSTNKIDRHDITEILLKVALNTINKQTNPYFVIGGSFICHQVNLIFYFNMLLDPLYIFVSIVEYFVTE